MSDPNDVSLDTELELLRQHHADRENGDEFSFDAALTIKRAQNLITQLRAELADRESSFELRWDADMRAIKRWQDAGGDRMTWPDHADMVVWLMEQLADYERSCIRRSEGVPEQAFWWQRLPTGCVYRNHLFVINDAHAPDHRPDLQGPVTLPVVEM